LTAPLEGGPYGRLLEDLSSRYQLFASCAADQLSYEDPLGLEGGVFGHYLADGLSGAADGDRDGVIRLNELVRYVTAQVQGWSRANLEPDDRPQKPVRLPSAGSADLALAFDPLRTRAVAAEATLRRLAARLSPDERRDAQTALRAGTDGQGRLNAAGSVFADWLLEVAASLSGSGSPPDTGGTSANPPIGLDTYRAYRGALVQSPQSPQGTLYRLLPPLQALSALPHLEEPGDAGKAWRDQTERLNRGELSPDEFSDWMDDWLSNSAMPPGD
jgi:hypothetical protein